MIYLFAILIVLSLFWQLENKRKAKRAEAHREKQEVLMDLLMKLKVKDNNNETKDHE